MSTFFSFWSRSGGKKIVFHPPKTERSLISASDSSALHFQALWPMAAHHLTLPDSDFIKDIFLFVQDNRVATVTRDEWLTAGRWVSEWFVRPRHAYKESHSDVFQNKTKLSFFLPFLLSVHTKNSHHETDFGLYITSICVSIRLKFQRISPRKLQRGNREEEKYKDCRTQKYKRWSGERRV